MEPAIRQQLEEERKFQHELYPKQAYIGEGAFGIVYKALNRCETPSSSSTPSSDTQCKSVAMKELRLSGREGLGSGGIPIDAYREIKILSEYQHPNIVRLKRLFPRPSTNSMELVYEYAEHDLAAIIKNNRHLQRVNGFKPLDQRMLKSCLYGILQGLSYLHHNWVMHRDIKPANILVTGMSSDIPPEEQGRIKIADFGLARVFQSPLRPLADDGEVVTIWYRAPELLLGCKHYTRAIDIWAVGSIFAELSSSTPLFPGEEVPASGINKPLQESQLRKIFSVLGKPNSNIWKDISNCPLYPLIEQWNPDDFPATSVLADRSYLPPTSSAYKLLSSMLIYDPLKRITAEEALQHQYFKEEPKPDKNVFRDVTGAFVKVSSRALKPLNPPANINTNTTNTAMIGNHQGGKEGEKRAAGDNTAQQGQSKYRKLQ